MNGRAVKRQNRVLRERASVVARAWMEQVWGASFGTRLRVAWVMVRGGPREFRRAESSAAGRPATGEAERLARPATGKGKEGRKTENGMGRAGR
jgi:hypothetical protein